MAAELDKRVFEAPIRPDLIHSVVVSQQAAKRRGTVGTKNRSLVSGGGKKPYKQKGTGRARQGSTRVVQFAGGGVAFGPQPRSYDQRIPKKVRAAALRSALSLRASEGAVTVVDSFELPEIKTKALAEKLRELGADDVLIVTADRDRTLELSARNMPHVRVLAAAGLNVRDIVARKHLVLTGGGLEKVVERLQ